MKRIAAVAAILVAGCTTRQTVERVAPRDPVTASWTVMALAAGVPENEILAEVAAQGVLAPPTADELVVLAQAGASDRLLTALIAAERTTSQSGHLRVRTRIVPDWRTIGDIAVGTLYVLGKAAEVMLRCLCN